MITINDWWYRTLFGRIGSCKNLTTSTDMWVPGGGDSCFSPNTRSKLAAAIAKGQQIVKPSISNANCKITEQKREENCKTGSWAMSTIIYSGFTITIRNIVIIPWHANVQMISSSCTHICNMQIVHLAYHHHVLTCNMQIMHLIYHTHVSTPATGTIIRY